MEDVERRARWIEHKAAQAAAAWPEVGEWDWVHYAAEQWERWQAHSAFASLGRQPKPFG